MNYVTQQLIYRFYRKLRKCLCYIYNSLMKFVNFYVQDRVHITQNTLFSHNLSSAKLECRQVETVKYRKMRLISIINIYPRWRSYVKITVDIFFYCKLD